jgi:hypothetical protein
MAHLPLEVFSMQAVRDANTSKAFAGRPILGLTLLLLAWMNVGCGGVAPTGITEPGCTAGFINQTSAPMDVFWQQWREAQHEISEVGVPLNAIGYASQGEPARTVLDPRASAVGPMCVTVVAVSDIPTDLLPAEYQNRPDPSGIVMCSLCASKYVHSYVVLGPVPTVYVAESLVKTACEYEFENIILYKLGYDLSGR